VSCAVSIPALVWWNVHYTHQRALRSSFNAAWAGDLKGVERLGADRSREADLALLRIATGAAVGGDVRFAAAKALGEKPKLPSDLIAELLNIEGPFYLRKEAAATFARRGCDEMCISAVLIQLRKLQQGEPTAETRLNMSHEMLRTDPHARKVEAEMRAENIDDYLRVLKKSPCAARNQLSRQYSHPQDASFRAFVAGELPRCD
jgi:hypothetical protein